MSLPNPPKASSVEDLTNKLNREDELTICQKVKFIINNITVEPMLFLLLIPAVMNNLTTVNMNLEKACRVNLQYNTSVCDAMVIRQREGYEKYQEQQVQKLVSNMISIKTFIIGSYPPLLMLFAGSWSDRHGRRKPLIIMPIVGDIVATVGLFLCAYFFLELPIVWSMIAETIPFALCGTWTLEFLGLYTYVSGISKEEERTIRIGTVSICQNISMTLGVMLSGIAIKILGYIGVYVVSSVLLSIGFIYGMVMVKESNILSENKNMKHKISIKEFFSTGYIKSTLKICFKEGPNDRRMKVIMLMLLGFMVMGPLNGEYTVLYLYTRLKYSWNEVDFSIYSFTQSIVQVSGGIFALSLFSKYLKFEDATLGIIATISKVSAVIIYAFAPTGLYFYVGCLVEVFHSLSHIAMRSIMAKVVPHHELGQTNSVFGIVECMTLFIFGPIYTEVYSKTIEFFPGAFYIITAFVYSIICCLFIWLYRANKNKKNEIFKQYEEVEQKEEQSMEERNIDD